MSLENLLEKVKKLRELTGVGFKDCKNALEENNSDIDKSIEFLRKKDIKPTIIKKYQAISFPRFPCTLIHLD